MISDESFPKTEHILKTGYFKRVYNKGRAVRKSAAALYFLPNAREANRVGFVIAARNVKLAVRRNRIRRLLRESYRKNKAVFKTGFDLVLVIRKEPDKKTLSYEMMKTLFLGMAKDAGVLA